VWDEYKKVNDSIHVPEELVNRTVKAAEREERRRKIIGLWKYTAIAACFCFVCLGIWGAAFKDKIVIQDVTFASSEMEIGLNLGKRTYQRRESGKIFKLKSIRRRMTRISRKSCGS
jgi:hypothetical protein